MRYRAVSLLASRRATGVAAFALVLSFAVLAGCHGPAAVVAPQPGPDDVKIHQLATVTPAEREKYLGSEACTGCHQEQASQLDTHHAETLAPAGGERDIQRFRRTSEQYDFIHDLTYHTGVRDGKPVLEARRGEKVERVAAEWAFGSGAHGITYLGTHGGETIELRLSYYEKERAWEFTPGQQAGGGVRKPVGRPMDRVDQERCFLCHTSALVRDGDRLDPKRSIAGVGCEACHGPGAEHVAAVNRGDPDIRMARLSQARSRISTELCGQCHRTIESMEAKSATVQRSLPRLQGLALSLSECYAKSGGRLSCVTCHDPHRDADRTSLVEYNRTCRSCHSSAARGEVPCPRAPQGDCVSCHMPAQAVDIPTSPRFRTHWIRVWDSTAGATAP